MYLVLKIEDQSDSGTHKGKLRNCSLTFADAEVLQLLLCCSRYDCLRCQGATEGGCSQVLAVSVTAVDSGKGVEVPD